MTDADAFLIFVQLKAVLCLYLNKKITGKTADGGGKDVEIMVSLKCLSNFWRTLEMPLIDCEINFILNWPGKFVLYNDTKAATFTITDTKLFIPVVTLSIQDNAQLLQQLKSDFKRTINCNKCKSKVAIQASNPYLGYFIDPSFQGVNILFVLSFENTTDRTVYTKHLPTVVIKDYNVMIDGQNFFDQPVKSNLRTYDNIQKIVTGQGKDYITNCLLDYNYFHKDYKMRAIDSSKQQALDADPKAILILQEIWLKKEMQIQQYFSLLKK